MQQCPLRFGKIDEVISCSHSASHDPGGVEYQCLRSLYSLISHIGASLTYRVHPLPALNDNYIWVIVHLERKKAAVVDPGASKPVLDFLKTSSFELSAILVTHHHWDHTQGLEEILPQYRVPVYFPASEPVFGGTHPVKEPDVITLEGLQLDFRIIDIPGHTLGHVAYWSTPWIFTGDTLFSAGCGKVFEGTPQQMYRSLMKLKQLDAKTELFCGHEYTLDNLKFAQMVEPHNFDIQQRICEVKGLREAGLPTLPSTLAIESKINPFLRCQVPSVIQSAEAHYRHPLRDETSVFAVLRDWKNQFYK